MYDLKNGVFRLYDALLTSLLLVCAVGLLGLVLVGAELWLALTLGRDRRGRRRSEG